MHIQSEPNDIPLQRCADLVIKSNTPKGTINDGITHLIQSLVSQHVGRGVFASAPIAAGTVIDICPVLLLGIEENKTHIEKSSLYHYTYNWPAIDENGKGKTVQAVIFGLGSMFNHSTQEQNVGWIRDTKRLVITYRALRNIPSGEELCISYGSRLTFEDADKPPVTPPEEEMEQLRMMDPY